MTLLHRTNARARHGARPRPAAPWFRVLMLGTLLALASRPCGAAAPAAARFLITAHGAVGDGATSNTRAIQATIDACAAAGGGVVVVPAGVFVSGAVYFKPGVNLELQAKAVLKSSTVMSEFPPIYTQWEGVERYWTSAFLNFVGLRDVVVTGPGTIDGSGLEWPGQPKHPRGPGRRPPAPVAAAPRPLPPVATAYPGRRPTTTTLAFAPDPRHLPPINAAGIALAGNPDRLAPPRALVFQDCTAVRIDGVHLVNPARWGFVFIYCRDVVARNLTVNTDGYIPSSDGMDLCSCDGVLVSGCDIACHDDNISIKSGRDADGRRVNRPSQHIRIEDCRFGSGGGVAIGSEVSGSVRDVRVERCQFVGTGSAARIKSQPSRGGVIADVVFRDLELSGVARAIDFDLRWRMVPPLAPAAPELTQVRDIRLVNIHGTAQSGGLIRGYPNRPFAAPSFEGVTLTTQRGLVLENVTAADMSGLHLRAAEGPAVIRVGAESARPPLPSGARASAPGAD